MRLYKKHVYCEMSNIWINLSISNAYNSTICMYFWLFTQLKKTFSCSSPATPSTKVCIIGFVNQDKPIGLQDKRPICCITEEKPVKRFIWDFLLMQCDKCNHQGNIKKQAYSIPGGYTKAAQCMHVCAFLMLIFFPPSFSLCLSVRL